MILMLSARIAQSAVTVRMQELNLHKLKLIKLKDNKNVQTVQVTQEVPQLPVKNAVLYLQRLRKWHIEAGSQPVI